MAILYLSDFEKYPSAIIDTESRNTSWVEMAAKFQRMHLRNYGFHLALLQPELRKYDPFDPDLPETVIQMMLLEMRHNPWYFFREIQRVPAKSGGGSNPLNANRGNIAMFWCVMNSFITYVQQIRQTGKSLNTRAIVNIFHNVLARESQHILFTKGDLRKQEIKEYKAMRDLLPKWMWYIHPKDRDNQHEFTTMSKKNHTVSYIPQGDPEAANGVGRGTSPALVTVDEPPFLAYAWISIPSLINATTASFDEAKRKGAMHAILYTTTAGDLSTEPGRFVYDKIKKRGMFFSEILYDCKDREDALKVIHVNSKGGGKGSRAPYIDISFTHLQLGYTDEWLQEKISASPMSRDQIKRDYLGQWTYGSAKNPIPEKILNRIRDHVNESPLTIMDKSGYITRYHVPVEEAKHRTSVMGLDLSNAVGRDCITGVMIDVETTETLAAFSINETNTILFARWLARFIADHPNMTLIAEAKNIWITILDYLLIELPLMGIDPGKRIYSRIVDHAEGSESEKRNYRDFSAGIPTERKYYPYRNSFGFPTSGPLREALYVEVMRDATNQAATLVRDPVLIDELSSLVDKNGRIDHSASGHDDHVISWLMANWFLREARNLDHYGIDTRKIMSRMRLASSGSNPKEMAKTLKQEKIAREIAELEERIDKAKTLMEERYLQAKLKSLKTEVRGDGDEQTINSIDRQSDAAKVKRNNDLKTRGKESVFGKSGLNLGAFKRR